jgi:hypothetical protein
MQFEILVLVQMPNWIDNLVTITGSQTDISMLIQKLASDTKVFSLESIVHTNDCLEDWGTKCDVIEDEIINQSETMIQYSFRTAWAAPHEALMALTKTWNVQLKNEYSNAYGPYGIAHFSNGVITSFDQCICDRDQGPCSFGNHKNE